MSAENALLDQLSTSQTKWARCIYGAPLVALIFNGRSTIQQSCCNHWDCPACGQARARQEYRKIVWGAEVLHDEDHKLYFWTITCRGRELSYDDAMAGYYEWTNKLLTSARLKAQRAASYWAYVQVTEHQQKTRAHPHSHIIITYCPTDAVQKSGEGRSLALSSEWFKQANIRAGLGVQCRISAVGDASAVSRYIAKYLFKASMTEVWPSKWKRVRYSRNWPTPPHIPVDVAITLLRPQDWRHAAAEQTEWICADDRIYEIASKRLANIRKRVGDIDF